MTKLDLKQLSGFFVGYSRTQKGYCCYSSEPKRYLVISDVTFFETTPFSFRPKTMSEMKRYLLLYLLLNQFTRFVRCAVAIQVQIYHLMLRLFCQHLRSSILVLLLLVLICPISTNRLPLEKVNGLVPNILVLLLSPSTHTTRLFTIYMSDTTLHGQKSSGYLLDTSTLLFWIFFISDTSGYFPTRYDSILIEFKL